MRYERKYRIEDSNYENIFSCIKTNPFSFRSSYPNRIVNSVYYDTIDYTSYNENLLGISNRIKYRVRWYGHQTQQIKNPVLEKKIKHNVLGTKEYINQEDFDLTKCVPEISSTDGVNLESVVLVQYDRTYLESYDRKIRATIDRNLRYTSLSHNKLFGPSIEDRAIILEIKYDENHYEHAMDCVQAIPYRLTKNSKFVSGMRLFLQ